MNAGMRFFACIILLFFSQLLFSQGEAKLNSPPVFSRYAGMHSKAITDIDADKTGNFILTTSPDGSTRLWNASDGQLIRAFLSENEIRGHSFCALSPDGSIAATGADALNIFCAKTGGQLRQSDDTAPITALRFSKDGQYLAVGTENNRITIYEVPSFKVVKEHELGEETVIAMDFDDLGWLVTASKEGLKFFDNNFNLNRSATFPDEKHPSSVAISPDGMRIAVGFYSNEMPAVYDAGSLELLYRTQFPDQALFKGSFTRVGFSHDGHELYAAGKLKTADNKNFSEPVSALNLPGASIIAKWGRMGRGQFGALPAGVHNVSAFKILPKGTLVLGSENAELVKLGRTGGEIFRNTSKANLFSSDDDEKLKVSANADEVIINFKEQPPVKFSLKTGTLEVHTQASRRTRFRPALQETPGIRIEKDTGSDNVLLNGEPIVWLEPEEKIHCKDIADHGLRFVIGSNRNIYCAGRDGEIIWKISIDMPVHYVNISGNTRVLVAAFDDGSLRWYRMDSGELLLSLFTYDGTRLWTVCTKSGFFDFSPGAENLGGVIVSAAKDARTAFFPLSDFIFSHHRPELIRQLVYDWDEKKAASRAGVELMNIKDLLPDPGF